jgi:hypothetical protein
MRELKVLKQVLLTLHTSSLEINVRRVTDVFTVLPYTVQTRSLNAHRHENTLSTR